MLSQAGGCADELLNWELQEPLLLPGTNLPELSGAQRSALAIHLFHRDRPIIP